MFFRVLIFLVSTVALWPNLAQGQEILLQFGAPSSESRGLTWDGQTLWCADAFKDKIYQIDPSDGQILSSFDYNMDYQYGGLGWGSDGYIWVADLESNQSKFRKLDSSSGSLISEFHCPGG